MITADLINSCRKQPKIYMQCRVTSSAMLALRSTTKAEWVMEILEVEEEEEQQLAEAKHRSLATNVANKDTMQELVTYLSQYVLIVNPMNTLLKTAPFIEKDSGKETATRKPKCPIDRYREPGSGLGV